MKIIGIIPARLKSTRFPGKPLVEIEGLPMIIHVMKRAMLCEDLDEVYVATDSRKIFKVVEKHGGKAIMTSEKHNTGTDRIAEAVENIKCDIVVNIQGDEPLVRPDHISKAIEPLIEDDRIQISTLMCETDQLNEPNECKMVVNQKNEVLYFSRSDIPSDLRVKHKNLLKLYSIVPFRKDFVLKFAKWDQTPLEKIEYIEYLRALEMGYKIKAVLVDEASQSVDTPQDLEIVKKLMSIDKLKDNYA
jgi:3-deoxy-manno-octulosonate cytidylyltransferase (CMP-KDO synthetase)